MRAALAQPRRVEPPGKVVDEQLQLSRLQGPQLVQGIAAALPRGGPVA